MAAVQSMFAHIISNAAAVSAHHLLMYPSVLCCCVQVRQRCPNLLIQANKANQHHSRADLVA
jgi:hypothetical protein